MEKFLSATNPLSFAVFVIHFIWMSVLLGAVCFASAHFIGHGFHNMPLAYFVMIIGASFHVGALILLLVRVFGSNK